MKRNEKRRKKRTRVQNVKLTVLFTLTFVSLTVQGKSSEYPVLWNLWRGKGESKTTPLEVKEQSHTTSADNIEGKLDQLWRLDGPPNWSKKARLYNIKSKGSDLTSGKQGQLVKAFLKSKKVHIAWFEPPSEVHLNSEDGPYRWKKW